LTTLRRFNSSKNDIARLHRPANWAESWGNASNLSIGGTAS